MFDRELFQKVTMRLFGRVHYGGYMKIKGIILVNPDVEKKGDALLHEAEIATANFHVIAKNLKTLSNLSDPFEPLADPIALTKYVKETNDTFQEYLDTTKTPPIPFPFVVTAWIATKYYQI